MKRIAYSVAAALALAVAAACGGGSTSPPISLPAPTSVPTATPSQGPVIANTSLTAFLPLAQGNYWDFVTGSRMTDVGSFTLSCDCAYNGGKVEQIDVSDSAGAYGGSFYFTKQAGTGGSTWTDLIGTKAPADTAISLLYDATYPQGLPVMDDVPSENETWSLTMSGVTSKSMITATKSTMTLYNGTQEIIDIAMDLLEQPNQPGLMLCLAPGVGFTSVTIEGEDVNLTSFHIDTLHSYVAGSQNHGTLQGRVQPGNLAEILRRLF